MVDMGDTEKARVKKQAEGLGEEGLKEKKEILEKATHENEVNMAPFIDRSSSLS